MQFLDGAIETWSLDYDNFAFIAKQQKPARLDLAIKLINCSAVLFYEGITPSWRNLKVVSQLNKS